MPRTLLGALLGAALVGAPGEAAAQSSLGFFPERHLVCREPRRVDAPSSPRPAPAVGLVPLPRRAAPAASVNTALPHTAGRSRAGHTR